MAIHRVQAVWSGFQGAPGYSSFYFRPFTGGGDVDLALNRVRDFFAEWRALLPTGVSIQVQSTVEEVDETTGMLTGYLDGAEVDPVNTSTSGADFAGPAGAVVNWLTGTVRNGRRMRGRTFLVPLNTNAYDTDGTLTSNALGDIRAGADLLLANEFEQELVVWGRPNGGSPGEAASVTGHRVPDMAAVLRSRRD